MKSRGSSELSKPSLEGSNRGLIARVVDHMQKPRRALVEEERTASKVM
jgi:hypothetical protein